MLGLKCHDLDVAISSLTGFDFANHVKEFLEKESNDSVKIHFIGSNPEKSKHLDTATTKLFDLDIDFVNLRKETYNADSRIPIMVSIGLTMIIIIVIIAKRKLNVVHVDFRKGTRYSKRGCSS